MLYGIFTVAILDTFLGIYSEGLRPAGKVQTGTERKRDSGTIRTRFVDTVGIPHLSLVPFFFLFLFWSG